MGPSIGRRAAGMLRRARLLLIVGGVWLAWTSPAWANQPPGPQMLLSEILILPLMMLLTALGGGYAVMRAAGVVLSLENHWGLTASVEGVLRIYQTISSPWLGVTLDIGNLMGDPYPQIEKLAPFATVVHFKTYFGGGVWYTHEIDYRRVAGILRQANYTGYVDLEMEGRENAETAVPKSLEVMQKAFA